MITGKQCKLARVLLDLSQKGLADHVGTSRELIVRFENTDTCSKQTIESLTLFFESRGVDFLPNNGVQEKTVSVQNLVGYDGFKQFHFDVIEEIRNNDHLEICIFNVNEKDWDKWGGKHKDEYFSQMQELSNYNSRIIIEEGDDYSTADYAEYKIIQKDKFGRVPVYVYGHKVAIIIFQEDNCVVTLIDNELIASTFRSQFDLVWSLAKDAK